MSYSHIIFDFNGTLTDSSEIIYEIVSGMIEKSGFGNITPKDFENIRDLPILKRIKVLIFTAMYTGKFLKLYSRQLPNLKFADGIKPMLTRLNENGLRYSVLSSNSPDMIQRLFELHQMPVGPIYTSHRLYGKKRAIKDFIKQNGCGAGDILYIGDEKSDIIACNKCGADIVFVKWGIGAGEDISGCDVKAIAQSPEELTEFLLGC